MTLKYATELYLCDNYHCEFYKIVVARHTNLGLFCRKCGRRLLYIGDVEK